MSSQPKRQRIEPLSVTLQSIDDHNVASIAVLDQALTGTLHKLSSDSQSFLDIIGNDCVQYAISFLEYREMCALSRVNKIFHRFITKESDKSMSGELLAHPAFMTFLYGERIECLQCAPCFALQHKYEIHDLNQKGQDSFEMMGRKGILKGQDMVLWSICDHFGFDIALFPVNSFDDVTGEAQKVQPVMIYNGSFCSLEEADAEDNETTWTTWPGPHIFGVDSTAYCWWRDLCPVVVLGSETDTFWSNEWRDTFLSKNIENNVYEHLLSTHPAFSGYNEWTEPSDYLIGYHLHGIYSESDLSRYSVEELAERGILNEMDMIVWRLCKHFGFRMRKRLFLNRVLNFENKTLIRDFPDKQWDDYWEMKWDEDEWEFADWHSIHLCAMYPDANEIVMVQIPNVITAPVQAVIEITCPANRQN